VLATGVGQGLGDHGPYPVAVFDCLLLVYLHLGREEAHHDRQPTQEEDPPTASSHACTFFFLFFFFFRMRRHITHDKPGIQKS
jgi:hypothetical protein